MNYRAKEAVQKIRRGVEVVAVEPIASISDAQASELARAVEESCVLRELNLIRCEFHEAGWVAVARGVENAKWLRTLHVGILHFKRGTLEAWARTLERNNSLNRATIWRHSSKAEDWEAASFLDNVFDSRALRALVLGGNADASAATAAGKLFRLDGDHAILVRVGQFFLTLT